MSLIIFVGLFIFVVFHLIEKIFRSFKVRSVDQKWVFITGCDSGFGKELAIRLDGLGFPVFAACLTEEGQKYLTQNASSRLTPLALDVTNSSSIQKALAFVKERLPENKGLWAIVNNAGIAGPLTPTEMCPMEGFLKTAAVNIFGPVEICQKFLPLVRKEKGRVVNMASVMGRSACATTAYNTSKFGMEGFSDSLRREVYDQGVKVSILEPGYFMTNLVERDTLNSNIQFHYDNAQAEVQQAYKDNFVKDLTDWVDRIQMTANRNSNLVVDAYVHAICSKFPKTRYVVGWDAKLFFVPLSYLPGRLADWILTKF